MSATQPASYAGPRDRLCYYCATGRPHFDAEHRRHVNQEISFRLYPVVRAVEYLALVLAIGGVCWLLTRYAGLPDGQRPVIDSTFRWLLTRTAIIGGAVVALTAAWNLIPLVVRRRLPDSEKAR